MDFSPHITIYWKKAKEICSNPTNGPLGIVGSGEVDIFFFKLQFFAL